MPQEDNELSWYECFRRARFHLFCEKSVKKYIKWEKKELKIYGEYLPEDAKILDIGCGLGIMSVSLSALGYDITGIDNDKKVMEAAKINAKNFGKKIKIMYMDIFDIDKRFKKDSFDACVSSGVLEHFSEEQIKDIVKKQLYLAPVVIATMPIALKEDIKEEYKDYNKKICRDGMYRNLWTPNYWINNVLKDFKILKKHVWTTNPTFGKFKELIVVIGRKS